MPRRVRKASYSRVGCLTCKERHKKCDGKRPECRTCIRLDLMCRQSDEFRNLQAPCNVQSGSSSTGFETQCFTFSAAFNPATQSQPNTEDSSVCQTTSLGSDFSPSVVNTPEYCEKDRDSLFTASYESPIRGPSFPPPCSPPSPTPLSASISRCISSCAKPITPAFDPVPESEDSESQARLDGYLIPAKINSFSNLSHLDWQNYQYYFERMSNLILNGHAPRNPLRTVAIPRIMSSPILLQAVCSISAQHRANTGLGSEEQLQRAATSYYLRALSGLKDLIPYVMCLQASSSYHNPETLEHVLLISIFLCKHEIIKSGVANWRAHLVGVESFCRFLEKDHRACSAETIMYARSFIKYHRSIASITEKAIMRFDTAHHQSYFDKDTTDGARYIIDPYMGLSQDLVSALHRVSHLSGFSVSDESQQVALQCEVMSIVQLVKARSWNVKLAFRPSEMSPDSILNLIYIARSYEHAVFAYLHSVIEDIAERDVYRHHLALWQDLYDQIPIDKNEGIAECLREMAKVPVNSPEEPGLLPLLFIISCLSENTENTFVVLKRVKVLATNFCLGNMNSISSFMNEMWSRRVDSAQCGVVSWRKLLAESKWDLMLS